MLAHPLRVKSNTVWEAWWPEHVAAGYTMSEGRMEREVKVGVYLSFSFYLVWDPMVPPQSVCL